MFQLQRCSRLLISGAEVQNLHDTQRRYDMISVLQKVVAGRTHLSEPVTIAGSQLAAEKHGSVCNTIVLSKQDWRACLQDGD